MDCKWDTALLQCSELLPPELLQIIHHGTNEQYLHSLTKASLEARYTYILFAHCEDIFAHICANLRKYGSFVNAIATLGRVIPFAPYLMPYAQQLLSKDEYTFSPSRNTDEDLSYLLGLFRLFSLDWRLFKKYIKPAEIGTLLDSSSRPIVYLAIRILQIYCSGADCWFEQMVRRWLGEDTPEGNINSQWDDIIIDYRFLTLWEEDRFRKMQKLIEEVKAGVNGFTGHSTRVIPAEAFDPSTAFVGGILLPREIDVAESLSSPNHRIIETSTISRNIAKIASALKASHPLLLTGLAGSGKTLLVKQVAHALSKLDSMITLHLNEQSDAKLLIGIYTTGETPGSFVWKPGVLTTAVEEGRWVLIEDLDRAPNEIIGTLLPLIEKGELLIPNRKQTIHAAQGFRIIATVRSTVNHRGESILPVAHMLGARHWQQVSIEMPQTEELNQIANELYPSLTGLMPQFMSVFESLQAFRHNTVSKGKSRIGIIRQVSPRDLLKWCNRSSYLLQRGEGFTSNNVDDIFLEAIDCFAGALPDSPARSSMGALIAEELRIDPRRRDFLLAARDVQYNLEKTRITIGRYSLLRSQQSKIVRSGQSSFSTNPHTNRMLEKVAAAVVNREPLLLVGETGVGKTTAVQHLAGHLGKKLIPFNLSQQSEAGDLMGGFKPISVQSLIVPLKDEFDELFASSFSLGKNQQFLGLVGKQTSKGNWKTVCKLWRQALKMVDEQQRKHSGRQGENPAKKRKVDLGKKIDFQRWNAFAEKVSDLERRLVAGGETAFAFSFVEGNIVRALRNGDWVLLDEINLASPDTLESIADLLDPNVPSLLLTESGSTERILAHPEFRVFAAMNPATDVGKKDLPPGIRSRLTELYVESPDRDNRSLQSIVRSYLRHEAANDQAIALDTSTLYQNILQLSEQNKLVDGAGNKPHFSLRTLTRTLSYAKYIAPMCSLRRALYEGFQMTFMTFLDNESAQLVQPLLERHLFGKRGNIRAELQKILRRPTNGQHVQAFSRSKHWVQQGNLHIEEQPHYILTPFIRSNLENLVRATSTRQFPVLIQGPTSSGKTSMIEFLAKRTGHKFVRINNHEHTDLQEYLGTYISGTDGRLHFQEGILVKALREGHWVVLDELNLAPSDVLEALNRLLDDNRELLIPETQEIVRPHDNFMLFATQNPAGLYGGRKTLSRAFRNRFLELHFDDIPVDELQEILHRRTQLPESRCKRIVTVYRELSVLRQENRLFEQKSFATLRDLFRWALRPNDTIQQLADNGYMLLVERVRKEEERRALKEIIEKAMSTNGPRVSIDENMLYSEDSQEVLQHRCSAVDQSVVWTKAMRRLYTLVSRALEKNEPVLLIGETGCGKTTVCQVLADALGRTLHSVNAHQNTETGDLIGSQRPVRNRASIEARLRHQLLSSRPLQNFENAASHSTGALLETYDQTVTSLPEAEQTAYCQSTMHENIQSGRARFNALFEWIDGSLVQAMREGSFFLLDEISLADDSVLERINSVLESQRTILLAEKGSFDAHVSASPGFQFFATMNPGGDYGKRELSPALRNRFTEIWVPPLDETEDIVRIVNEKLTANAKPYASAMVAFGQWFNTQYNTSASSSVSIRDALSWVQFVNAFAAVDVMAAVVHGAAMIYIDTLGANPAGLLAMTKNHVELERSACVDQLSRQLCVDARAIYSANVEITISTGTLAVGPFVLRRKVSELSHRSAFSFEPRSTINNTMRIVRALQLTKPVMLEGDPGVGKTAIITAIAEAVGIPLTRVNLSEQTDLIDLFGSDVPVEGDGAGSFTFRDAPFLRAMKNGEWVLLDEMNLASQSILEGLNACLDHRGEVFVPELNQTFSRHPDFRLFAAQNPHHQGGGRKGLPASFVNRFTIVFADAFRPDDLKLICQRAFPQTDPLIIEKVVSFLGQLDSETVHQNSVGASGAPWEFNLRDAFRLLSLITSDQAFVRSGSLRDFVDVVFVQRFRSASDKEYVLRMFHEHFEDKSPSSELFSNISAHAVQLGIAFLPRDQLLAVPNGHGPLGAVWRNHLRPLQSIMLCVQQTWPLTLTGSSGAGKTFLIEHLAAVVGAPLVTIAMSSESDAMDLIGGYEQSDPDRQLLKSLERLRTQVDSQAKSKLTKDPSLSLLSALEKLHSPMFDDSASSRDVIDVAPLEDVQHKLRAMQDSKQAADKASFEWIDGILIDALEEGKWLVLDNANLCSPSVLDRLNSLLEPGGVLMINEHSNTDGSPRSIRPHPNFRVFLTVNPRYGELSRAMRNRTVELFIPGNQSMTDKDQVHPSPSESAVSKLQQASVLNAPGKQSTSLEPLALVVADHMGVTDRPLLQRFDQQVSSGLFGLPKDCHKSLSNAFIAAAGVYDVTSSMLQRIHEARLDPAQAPADFASVQTLHPLNNQALVQFPQHTVSLAHSMALAYDFATQFFFMRTLLNSMGSDPLILSKLQHVESSIGLELQRHTKASTILDILQRTMNVMLSSSSDQVAVVPNNSSEFRTAMNQLASLFGLLLEAIKNGRLRVESLKAFASIGQSVAQSSANRVTSVLSSALTDLGCLLRSLMNDAKCDNTQVCSVLWKAFKPATPATKEQLEGLLSFEAQIEHFDNVCNSLELPLEELARLRVSFSQALELALRGGQATMEMSANVERLMLESSLPTFDSFPARRPHFTQTFRQLHQHFSTLSLGGWRISQSELAKLEILALRKVKDGISYCSGIEDRSFSNRLELLRSTVATLLEGPAQSNSQDNPGSVLTESLSTIDQISLSGSDLLEQEIKSLGALICAQTHMLADDGLHSLDSALKGFTRETLLAFGNLTGLAESQQAASVLLACLDDQDSDASTNDIERSLKGFRGSTGLTFSSSLRALSSVVNYLRTSQNDGHERTPRAANAWASFACACLELYVPETPYDPALDARLRRDIYRRSHRDLTSRLNALNSFRHELTGETNSLRARFLEEDIEALGVEPLDDQVYRPEVSQLSELQSELSALRRIMQPIWQHRQHLISVLPLNSNMLSNIIQIRGRLSQRFRAYDDFTAPVAGFIDCLLTAHRLALYDARQKQSGRSLASIVPYVGASINTWSYDDTFVDVNLGIQAHADVLCWLSAVSARSHIRSMVECDQPLRQAVEERFYQYYLQWKTELAEEQKAVAQKSSLYRFKQQDGGLDEPNVEELQEMFPTNEAAHIQISDKARAQNARAVAHSVANLHLHIFVPQSIDRSSMFDLLRQWLYTVTKNVEVHDDNTIPAAIHALGEVYSHLTHHEHQKRNYDMYTDSNLTQSKKLIGLVDRTVKRFTAIQQTWPDHATPVEVLRLSDDLLAMSQSTPLSLLLPRLETLHNAINQWQTIASREFSVSDVLDAIAGLLIEWRRLELSSWAGLFDREWDQCQQDAASWWYIAYETIVAASREYQDSTSEVVPYVENLLKTLGDFMLSSGLGEFNARLQMLRGFEAHLLASETEDKHVDFTRQGLSNFIAYYSRFVAPVNLQLSEGRDKLAKELQDIIQLASWKDRNIEVLRQSAHSSHRKLFRIVRKFRALLAKPVEPIIQSGFSDRLDLDYREAFKGSKSTYRHEHPLHANVSTLLAQNETPDRFCNVSATAELLVSKMRQVQTAFNAPHRLQLFTKELEQSISELQRSTPGVLTDENKAFVLHLKTRKRRLFADVLKEARKMGLQTAVSDQVLRQQSNLYTILAHLSNLGNTRLIANVEQAEHAFYRLLDTLPLARQCARKPSDDLTFAEVTRCIYFLESLMQTCIVQQHSLSHQIAALAVMEKDMKLLRNFSRCKKPSVRLGSTSECSVRTNAASYLDQMLHLSLELLRTQETLSTNDYSKIISDLQRHKDQVHLLETTGRNMPFLPLNITSGDDAGLAAQWATMVGELTSTVVDACSVHPELRPTLRQLLEWTAPDCSSRSATQSNGYHGSGLKTYMRDLFETIDLILVSVQEAEKLPIDVEKNNDNAWLVRQRNLLDEVFKTLRVPTITQRISHLNRALQIFENHQESLPLVAALVDNMCAIIEAYQRALYDLINASCSTFAQICGTASILATYFVQIATHGFCAPTERAQDDSTKQSGDVESGTGLGEGDGTEDISKDVGDDEDLSEIAQDPTHSSNGEDVVDEKDAVDMADEEMEGDVGEPASGSDAQDDADNDQAEEAAEIDTEMGEDNLGSNAVDEKLWDGADDQTRSEKRAESGQGDTSRDELAATEEQHDADIGDQGEEAVKENEAVTNEGADPLTDSVDPHAVEEDNLDLPEDMEVDGHKQAEAVESDLESLSDSEDPEGGTTKTSADEQAEPRRDEPSDVEVEQAGQDTDETREVQEVENEFEETNHEDLTEVAQDKNLDKSVDDVGFAESGEGPQEHVETGQTSHAGEKTERREEEQFGEDATQENRDGEGAESTQGNKSFNGNNGSPEDHSRLPFKQLGDILEKWYKKQSKIEKAQLGGDGPQPEDIDMDSAKFEHLPDGNASADAQALGTASAEQATSLNEDNAIAGNDEEDTRMPINETPDQEHDIKDVEHQQDRMQLDSYDDTNQEPQQTTFVGERRNVSADVEAAQSDTLEGMSDLEDDVQERFTNTHISSEDKHAQVSFEDARALWLKHETSTRNLSLVLTEHLRLILQPTLATKMRGDFRTGKRLNIKRIIPYIASSYKRDKIWMRRSMPSKRSYQIMLAIDDSKSMIENDSRDLAFETLALVAKSMTMLEVGELSVVAFGEDVNTTHDFGAPFTSDTGARILQRFTFDQSKTNIERLLFQSIELFRSARVKASGSSSDLWQLQLIISDGICEDHSSIRRLVRQAYEERIMMVFIVVDALARPAGAEKGARQSILDLQTAEFVNDASGEMQLKMTKYLDSFPFHYYLIVRDVQELPGVLAGALRQWFSEVVESGS